MPNPKGNLAGWSDPEVPGWQDRLLTNVRQTRGKSHRWHERGSGLYIAFDRPFKVLLREAARRRGINMTGYCRRAIAAFIAHDLGAEYDRVGQHLPYPTEYREEGGHGRTYLTEDNGTGYGAWQITAVEEIQNEEASD